MAAENPHRAAAAATLEAIAYYIDEAAEGNVPWPHYDADAYNADGAILDLVMGGGLGGTLFEGDGGRLAQRTRERKKQIMLRHLDAMWAEVAASNRDVLDTARMRREGGRVAGLMAQRGQGTLGRLPPELRERVFRR